MSFINGKIGLVTGGASGIGFFTVKELLKNGLKGVVIADVNEANGNKAVQELAEEFGANRLAFIKTDVSQLEEVEAALSKTVDIFKHLDIIINSAGILNDSTWQKEIAINLNGTINFCLLGLDKYLPANKTGDEGVILNISSTLALIDADPWPIYAATKGAIISLSRSLGTENHYRRSKVRILTVCPGPSDTSMLANIQKSFIGPQYKEFSSKLLLTHSMQKPEAVAKCAVRAIEEGQNGSFWIVNSGKVYQVKIPNVYDLIES